ncbi:protein kinase domain-containing protein [Schnuerera sp.]|uniref:protein kinase domain-containing protein n=1 Tax=Schnuerera sp. TaxID=2794844 RepID=UPI002BFEC11A|nr:protein kinase [Schnuerera sp.]HSH34628.1 protein kinase [Schnuerera sp.]
MIIRGKWNKNKYKIIDLIGSGNFGKVYRGIDEKGNIKAIKVSKDLLSITNEYNAMVRLKNFDFIPKVYDFDDWYFMGETYNFIVMDYILGKNLKEINTNKKMSLKTIFKIGKILVNILDEISKLGYKYTDIKLENIIIDVKGKIYFVDFASLSKKNMPTKEYTPTYNINSWNVKYNYNKKTGILFGITMIMVTLIGGKEYNPLVVSLEEIIERIDRFSIKEKEKIFLQNGLKGNFVDFNQYSSTLSKLIDGSKSYDNLNKIDYILVASIVSFVFVVILGLKSILS